VNIRSVSIETDLPSIVSLVKAWDPSDSVNLEDLRSQCLNDPTDRKSLRLVAVNELNAIKGYSLITHPISAPANSFYVWIGVDAALRRTGIGSSLWDASLAYLQEKGATRIASEIFDNDPVSQDFAEKRGFAIDRHWFNSVLDLSTLDETPYLPDIAALEAQGIRFCFLSEFPDTPENHKKFLDLNYATVLDIPGENWNYDAYPQFFEEKIVGASWFKRENQLIAVDGDTWVGMAELNLRIESQKAYNDTTGVIRSHRRRKIALALKVLAACYVRSKGKKFIQTDNDSLNAPMLAINRKMGYQPQSGKYMLVRWLVNNTSPSPVVQLP